MASVSRTPRFGVAFDIPPTTLTADDLLLRPFTEADEVGVAAAMGDGAILSWAAGLAVNAAEPADRARLWLVPRLAGWSSGVAPFAVADAGDGTLLGYVGLRDIHRAPDQAVAAYWTTPAARGRRVAARALDAAATWAFSPAADGGLGLHRISLDHAMANPASCRVATRAGFREEGVMRESFVAPDGTRHDSHLHARLAPDPRPDL
ncbi:GNAT family N-acetyltransferase [Actinacidiphila acidipaludis]|uniref:GNAT family N-acetyltransferase n=1 Tax=Actinacidiphila acidipaludis TaxID=2873382 RepID=A0ABS7QG71_9ACTN|nr:GNAT family protein [Streptomyces acidipaludis]MBY8882173.1 GNAT family N-acetyltransferase [Streptomyces acidipaludis]